MGLRTKCALSVTSLATTATTTGKSMTLNSVFCAPTHIRSGSNLQGSVLTLAMQVFSKGLCSKQMSFSVTRATGPVSAATGIKSSALVVPKINPSATSGRTLASRTVL